MASRKGAGSNHRGIDGGARKEEASEKREPSSLTNTNPQLMPFHPAADIFPLMEGDEFDELVADIQRRGLHVPITVHNGEIIDGRNRARACQKAGVEPRYTPFQGKDEDVVRFIISANIHKRHLDPEDRRKFLKQLIEWHPDKSVRELAKIAGVSKSTVARCVPDGTRPATRLDSRGRKQPTKKPRAHERIEADDEPPSLREQLRSSRETARSAQEQCQRLHRERDGAFDDLAKVKKALSSAKGQLAAAKARIAELEIERSKLIRTVKALGRSPSNQAEAAVTARPSNTVTDAQGHKWKLRFTQYKKGWIWNAVTDDGLGKSSADDEYFATRDEARADARRDIGRSDCNHVAQAEEFWARLSERGTPCRMTAEDYEAIERAGRPDKDGSAS